jgi:hypothetical protein
LSLPTLTTLAGYAAIAAVVPPLTSAAVLAVLPRAKARMPGGAARFFRALWLQGAGIIVGFLAVKVVWDTLVGGPPPNSIGYNALVIMCALAASAGSAWLFRRLTWTAPLVRDLAATMRPNRPTNLGKA